MIGINGGTTAILGPTVAGAPLGFAGLAGFQIAIIVPGVPLVVVAPDGGKDIVICSIADALPDPVAPDPRTAIVGLCSSSPAAATPTAPAARRAVITICTD